MALITPFFQLPTELEILDNFASRREAEEPVSLFQLPTEEELRSYYSGLDHSHRLELMRGVSRLAGEHLSWAEWHLFDDLNRLTRAVIAMKKPFWGRQSESHANLIAAKYPLIANQEWERRLGCLRGWESLKGRLFEKYPSLEADFRVRAFKAQELFFLTFPAPMDLAPMQSSMRVLEALIAEEGDAVSAGIILDRLLTRESLRPTAADIAQTVALKALERATREKIYSGTLQKSTESTYADVYYIHFPEGEGKFKPLQLPQARKEAYGSLLDRDLGFEMTIPTRFFQTANFWQLLEEARTLFLSASEEAHAHLKKRAFDRLQSSHIPAAARNAIFGEMYVLYGNGRKIDCLGEKMFYDREEHRTTVVQKARAIQKYLDSEVCQEHLKIFRRQGSIQTWIRNCGRAFDLIVKDPDGGRKLKTAPKALVHLYALMGMLKGSMDCSTGNTFVHFDPALDRVVNFLDFDDERSMPEDNNWWSMRLWQLGLPQCVEPFDRSIMLLFADETLLDRLKKHTRLGKGAHDAQIARFQRMRQLFHEELSNEKMALSPRELFFHLFGGREHYDYVNGTFNGSKFPVALFEFQMGDCGRGADYPYDEYQQTIIANNMKALYSKPD